MPFTSTNGFFEYDFINTSGDSLYDDDKYKQPIIDAIDKWDQVITAVPYTGWKLTITIDFRALTPGILGGAGNYIYNEPLPFGSVFITSGSLTLNVFALNSLYSTILSNGKRRMYYVALHEIGHLMGIGRITFGPFPDTPKVSYIDDDDGETKYYYNGTNAVDRYKSYFPSVSSNIVGIPIEDDGQAGSVLVHPEEGDEGAISIDDRYINGYLHPGLGAELMTAWLDSNTIAPLSEITIGFIEDIGFSVDYNQAETYTPQISGGDDGSILSPISVNVSDGVFSPFYDITWSLKYEVINWSNTDDYGLCFFLQDSSSSLEYGGWRTDLGYSGDPGSPSDIKAKGMTGGMLGVGLDTHGAFATETTWPGGALRSGLSAVELNSISVRGSELSSYEFLDTHYKINEFELLSDGIKILRARLGNYGRTIFLDYRPSGDTDFINILTKDVDLDVVTGDRLTPGVSFAKPLTSADTEMIIKVHAFHVEGKESDPDVSQQVVESLDPLDILPYTGDVIDDIEPIESPVQSPVTNPIMCMPPSLGDIIVLKTEESTGPYETGQYIFYKIIVSNVGSTVLNNTVLTDTIPSSLRLNVSGDTELFSSITLQPGESKEVTYEYEVTLDDSGVLVSTAVVITRVGVTDSSTLPVLVDEVLPLSIIKSLDPDYEQSSYIVGDRVYYKVLVGNPNGIPVSNVLLTDTLQPNIKKIIDSVGLLDGGVELAANSVATVRYYYTSTTNGVLENTATVSSNIGISDDNISVNIGKVEDSVDPLVITKELVSTDSAYLSGSTISYSVSVTNPNPDINLNGVILTDTLSDSGGGLSNVVDGNNLFSSTTIPANTTYIATYDYIHNENRGGRLVNYAKADWTFNSVDYTVEDSVTITVSKIDCVFVSITDSNGNGTAAETEDDWRGFRGYHSDNNFYVLLDEYVNEPSLELPDQFYSDSNAQVVEVIKDVEMDWFTLLGLSDLAPGTTVYFWVDTTASQNGLNRHTDSYAKLVSDCATAGITIVKRESNTERYFEWHASLIDVCQDL